eukprot:517733-Prorocentrum_lima.AAC.1
MQKQRDTAQQFEFALKEHWEQMRDKGIEPGKESGSTVQALDKRQHDISCVAASVERHLQESCDYRDRHASVSYTHLTLPTICSV